MIKKEKNNQNFYKKTDVTKYIEEMWEEMHDPIVKEREKYLQNREERAKMIKINAGL